jgi:hypothetical protein
MRGFAAIAPRLSWPDPRRSKVATSSKEAQAAQARAEATFKRKEQQARDGAVAMKEYNAAGLATREKTARLRELRLAKEAADREAAKSAKAAPKAKVAKKK